jgi:hypothetical protein
LRPILLARGLPLKFLLFLLGVMLFWPLSSASPQIKGAPPGGSVQSSAPKAKENQAEALPETFSGLSSVVPAARNLAEDAANVERTIPDKAATAEWNTEIGESEARLTGLCSRISRMGDAGTWDLLRLSETKAAILDWRRTLEVFAKNVISSSLKELESIRKEWEKRRKYWEA